MAYTTINKSGDYFNTKLFTGNGADNHAITGVGFQPDWIWAKNRANTDAHHTADVVNGAGYRLRTNTADALGTQADGVKSFDSDGFTLGTTGSINGNGNGIVSWNWKAGGSGSSNTDGSITSTVSANTTAGFSIVKYTGNASAGATIGHGLGVIPKVMIVKNLSEAYNWAVYHEGLGSHTKYLYLDASNAVATDSGNFDNVPTSSTFLVGSNSTVNKNGNNYIAYCFAEKKGFSKFGSYTGNGSASSGTFIYTGFKPAFVMIKRTDTIGSWEMYDAKREGFNPQVHGLTANTSNVEDNTDDLLDLLSNGFKLYHDGGGLNASGGSYIYMAFSEEPLVANSGTDGVPATAR